MGAVRKYSPHRSWTKEEEEMLRKICEKKTQSGIAKALGRSKTSVKAKRIRLGLGGFMEMTDKFNIGQVAELTGLNQRTISRTWGKYGLKFHSVGQYRVVSEKSLLDFMKTHPERWKASKCDYYFFCRHKWFREKLEREKTGNDDSSHYQNRKQWTENEVSRLKMLLKRGLTHKEIADELGRTKRAIDHKVIRLHRMEEQEKGI